MIMTRPGLLHENMINVGSLDEHVVLLSETAWKQRPDVLEFLGDLNLTNYLSLTTGE